MSLYFADEALVVTNPEVSSVRDSDRILGILASRSRRAEQGDEPVKGAFGAGALRAGARIGRYAGCG